MEKLTEKVLDLFKQEKIKFEGKIHSLDLPIAEYTLCGFAIDEGDNEGFVSLSTKITCEECKKIILSYRTFKL